MSIDWGAHQQMLATATFHRMLVEEKQAQRKAAIAAASRPLTAIVNEHQTKLAGAGKADDSRGSGGISTIKTPLPSTPIPDCREVGSSMPKLSLPGSRPPSQPRPSSQVSGDISGGGGSVADPNAYFVRTAAARQKQEAARKRTMERIVAVREANARLQEERIVRAEREVKRKNAAVATALVKRAQEHARQSDEQRSKAEQVKEVVARMGRAAEVKRMTMIRQLEDDAASRAVWHRMQHEKTSAHRDELKLRVQLQHATKEYCDRAHYTMEKAVHRQEVAAVDGDGDVQRHLKDESRAKLLRLLREEDHLIKRWQAHEVHAADVSRQLAQGVSPKRAHTAMS